MNFAKYLTAFSVFSFVVGITYPAQAIIQSFDKCLGANDCRVTSTPPDPVQPDPNNGILLAWDERQNVTLTQDLKVDRVFDPSASFVSNAPGGDFYIEQGTVVSSHYYQWDPGNGSNRSVQSTLNLDSQVFAFMTEDDNLFNSDSTLGLPGLDYNDFTLRGLESGDATKFNGDKVDINWGASSPGDWTRLVTARSPSAEPIPFEAEGTMGLVALGGYLWYRNRKKRKQALVQDSNN